MKSLLREPLVHFLALGALLFLFFEWRGGVGASAQIRVTPGLVEHLASGFAKAWQRPPSEAELKGLIDDYVKDEIATREAIAMGLDRDDTIVRRRLRQKLEFLVEDAVDQVQPTDAQLQAWLDKRPDGFRAEPRLALRQVYFKEKDAAARAEAERVLARLRARGPAAKTDALGHASLLPRELPLGPLSEVTRTFGGEFATQVEPLAAGQWSGPIESPFGLHLVLVVERAAGVKPTLADVRPLVEREFLAERRRAQLQALYDRLLLKYAVAIEMPKPKAK